MNSKMKGEVKEKAAALSPAKVERDGHINEVLTMGKFSGVKHEGRGHYSIWFNGDVLGSASNPTQAQAKFEKEVQRALVNAERERANAAWTAKRAEVEYSFAERNGMVTT